MEVAAWATQPLSGERVDADAVDVYTRSRAYTCTRVSDQ